MTDNSGGTTRSSPLGTGEQSGSDHPFLMSTGDLLLVQVYVEGGIQLPIDGAEAISKLSIPKQDAEKFDPLWQCYKSIHDHCLHFKDQVYPQTVALASDIYDYGKLKVPIFYGRLTTVYQQMAAGTLTEDKGQAQLKSLLSHLKTDAIGRQEKAAKAKADIANFVTDMVNDSGNLKHRKDDYAQEYEGLHGKIAQFELEIVQDQESIDKYNKDYKEYCLIARTTASYAWIVPFGLIAAATVAGIYGKKAQDALDHVHEFQKKKEQVQGDLGNALRIKDDLKIADASLTGITSSLTAARTVLGKIEGLWQGIADGVDHALSTLKNDIENGDDFIAALSVDVAIEEWGDLAGKADLYVKSAYIQIKTVEEIQADPDAYREAA
jgi:hypothetical protein